MGFLGKESESSALAAATPLKAPLSENSGTIDPAHPFIQQQMLDDPLRDYIRMLTNDHPFSFDIKIDERHIVSNLAAHWPHYPEWVEQAERLWKCIDQVVQAIPAIKTVPLVLLRVSAAATPLVPTSIPSPHSYSTLATFDAEGGRLFHCVLPGMADLPPLEAMKVGAGIMVICQPLPTLLNQFSDNRGAGLGAGNVYTDRATDEVILQTKIDPAAAPRPIAAPANKLG